jgi:hypothetical protein
MIAHPAASSRFRQILVGTYNAPLQSIKVRRQEAGMYAAQLPVRLSSRIGNAESIAVRYGNESDCPQPESGL